MSHVPTSSFPHVVSGNPLKPKVALLLTYKQPCVYMMASRKNGTLYTGVTSDLVARVGLHKTGAVPGFTSKYGVHILVYFESHDSMEGAIVREKQIKKWLRAWKIAMIEKDNPEWFDLYSSIVG